jgi:hypothetical protein
MKRLTAIVLCAAVLSSCATTTTINSVPPGATVYIDDRVMGQTPVRYSDSSVFWQRHDLQLRKQGYRSRQIRLRKDQLRVGPLVGAIFVVVPGMWLLGYPPAMTYELEPAQP